MNYKNKRIREGEEKIAPFRGFSKKSFAFLRDLEKHNNREWFQAHRDEFDDAVIRPLLSLSQESGQAMLSIDPDFEVRPAVGKTVSRIYRDTRFSKDKSPYKTSLWIVFTVRTKERLERPAFFFEITGISSRWGMGFYSASRSTMDLVRAAIDDDPALFKKVFTPLQKSDYFSIEGEDYRRRLPNGYPEDDFIQKIYQKKSFYLVHNAPAGGELLEPSFADALRKEFLSLGPIYRWLCDAIG